MSRFKKLAAIMAAIALLLLGGLTAFNVYAAKPIISLNSPVSFPVDI